MLETIKLERFKSFQNTEIGPLRQVNLIVGGQNVGKTSLLEAVHMTLNFSAATPFRPNEGNDAGRFVSSALGKSFGSIELKSSNDDRQRLEPPSPSAVVMALASNSGYWHPLGTTLEGHCQWWRAGQQMPAAVALPLFLPDQLQLVQLFGHIVLSKKKRELIELLQKIEPRLLSLDAASPDNEQRIYVEISDVAQALPLPQVGHGFARLLYLYCSLLSTQAQLALIDEVEDGIHYSALPFLMQGIKNVTQQRDVQIMMTTHSWECIQAAHAVFKDSPDDFQIIRLERTADDNVQAVLISGEQLDVVLKSGWEIR